MMIDPQLWDLIKLALSFGGTLAIAWLAVRWALARFQREKAWERRFNAYADAIAAMGEMRLVLGLMIDEIEDDRSAEDKVQEERWARYSAGKRKLEQAEAVAGLLFPDYITGLIVKLMTDIDDLKRTECGVFPAITNEYSLLDDAIHQLSQQARSALNLSSGQEKRIAVTQVRPSWLEKSPSKDATDSASEEAQKPSQE